MRGEAFWDERRCIVAVSLPYDPGRIEAFKESVRHLPGYPAGEEIPLRNMVFESGAVFRLPGLLAEAGAQQSAPVLVVMDNTPMQRAGADLKTLILETLREAGWQAVPVWLEPDESGQVHADMAQVGRVQASLIPGAAVLSVGSGTVTDIAKHAAHLHAENDANSPLPFVVYQTANSVNAFTSRTASVFVDGVKRTLPSRYADLLVCDLETLRDAPPVLTAAGVGDVVAALSSLPDWYLQHRLGMAPNYSELALALMGPLEQTLLSEAESIRAGSLDGVELLAKLLTLGGLAMSLSHQTTPMSGVEHGVSHLLDSLATLDKRPLALHGAQVGLATILTSATFRILVEEFDRDEVNVARCFPGLDEMRKRLSRALDSMDPTGRATAECWPGYAEKLRAWHAQRETFAAALADWQSVKDGIAARMAGPETVAAILRTVGAPMRFGALEPPVSDAQAKFAYTYAPFVRSRPMLCDVVLFLNWDSEALWSRVWTTFSGLAEGPAR